MALEAVYKAANDELAVQQFMATVELWLNLETATTAAAEFIEGLIEVADISLGVDTTLANQKGTYRVKQVPKELPTPSPMGANTNPATMTVREFSSSVAKSPASDTAVGANTFKAVGSVSDLEGSIEGRLPSLLLVGAATSLAEAQIDEMLKRQAIIAVQLGGSPSGDQSGLKRAGGYVSGAGSSTSDSIMA